MLNSWPLAKDLQVLVEIVHSGSFSARPHLSPNESKSLKTRWQRRYLTAPLAAWH